MDGPVYHYSLDDGSARWLGFLLAAIIHLLLIIVGLSIKTHAPENKPAQFIEVSFVDIPIPGTVDMSDELKPTQPSIKPLPVPIKRRDDVITPDQVADNPATVKSEILAPIVSPEILQSSQPAKIEDSGISAPPKTSHIPSRWALKPPLATSRLVSLGFSAQDIECLTALKDDCKELRELVFAEYRLTDTELVWTPNRADTGMPAEFRGMTHQQIMEKLGMNYAGGNALQILPGIVIDGPLWDKLHGVNKTCRYVQYFSAMDSAQPGTLSSRRVCD